MEISNDIEERILKLVDKSMGCWEWKGAMNKKWNKPFIKKGRKKIFVHRWFYEKYYDGGIPERGMIFRSCWNQKCVNPKHLQLVMPGETQPRIGKELDEGFNLAMSGE